LSSSALWWRAVTNSGQFGVKFSARALWVAVPATVIIALAGEPVIAGVWQFMTALPKGFTAAIVVTGLVAIGAAFLSENLSDRGRSALRALALLSLCFEAFLFIYAVYFYYPPPTIDTAFAPLFHMAYSNRQTLRLRKDGSYENAALNLDNVATLYLSSPFNAQMVTLSWAASPPITVANPGPSTHSPEIHVWGARIFAEGEIPIQFDHEHPVHLIGVGDRIFRVSLESSTDNRDSTCAFCFEYEFAISEAEPSPENRAAAIMLRSTP
jgi:hypothetical protein